MFSNHRIPVIKDRQLLFAHARGYSRASMKNMKTSRFDIIVIGAGAAGLNVASFMNKAGFSVLLIEKEERNIGGDCLNFGCVPSKALIHAAREVHSARQARGYGLEVTGDVSMRQVREQIERAQDAIRVHENATWLREQGITVEIGTATFTAKNTVAVGGKRFRGKKIILATGGKPRELDSPGINEAPVYTNETIFDIQFLPKRLVIVGGGPIGVELGQAFHYLGSDVTIVDKSEQFLPKEDPEIAAVLAQKLKKDGIMCLPGSDVTAVEDGKTLVIERDGEVERLPFDALFVGIGRVVDITPLNPRAAGIKCDERGRPVIDEYLRTTNKNVLAVGDVVGGLQFTHATELHAGLVIRNFFAPFKKKLDTDHFAWVTFTDPEVATFGLSEAALKKRRIPFRTVRQSFAEDDRAIIDQYRDGLLKLFVSPSGKILGGSMVAPGAGELVHELILAMSAGLSAEEVFNTVYPYPTAARINKRAISGIMSERLTPLSKKILRWLYH